MKANGFSPANQVEIVYRRIQELGLERNVAELDARGFTIVPPEVTGAGPLVDRLAARLLTVAEERRARTDMTAIATHGTDVQYYMLTEGEVFEHALMHSYPMALISYLLGDSCVLSSMIGMVKGPGEQPLPLHVDNGPGVPEPLPAYAQVANATWLLSDYDLENGSLCFVPGSHRLCRHPSREETDPRTHPGAIPVVAPKGSLVVWHGNLFHGAYPRTAPGQRLNLIMFFVRAYFRTQEEYRGRITPEMLSRNSERFASVLGLNHPYPADFATGIDPREVAAMNRTSRSIHA